MVNTGSVYRGSGRVVTVRGVRVTAPWVQPGGNSANARLTRKVAAQASARRYATARAARGYIF